MFTGISIALSIILTCMTRSGQAPDKYVEVASVHACQAVTSRLQNVPAAAGRFQSNDRYKSASGCAVVQLKLKQPLVGLVHAPVQ